MRNNQPVSGREHPFPDGQTLISYTNAKGQITRANDAFVELSGFSRQELMGQAHNIVRHPDMPPEAFRDLWDTIKKGRPWTGLVKNRRKDGDHYWVRAYASPLADGSGYVSVRVAPSRQETRAAEDLYAKMQTNDSIKLDEGQVVSNSVFSKLTSVFSHMRIVSRMWFLSLSGLLGFALAIALGWYSVDKSESSLKSVYEDRAVPMYDLSMIDSKIRENYNDLTLAFQHDPASPLSTLHGHPVSQHLDATKERKDEINALWKKYMATYLTEEEKKLAAEVDSRRSAWQQKIAETVDALKQNNYSRDALQNLLKAGREERAAFHEALDKLIVYQTDVAKAEYEASVRTADLDHLLFSILLAVGTLGMLLQSWTIIRRVKSGLQASIDAANSIASGDLTKPLPAASKDELGELVASLSVMRNNLHELIANVREGITSLNQTSSNVSASAHNSSKVTEMQSEAASGMAAAMEELSVSIDQVSEHAKDAYQVSQTSSKEAGEGGAIIQSTAGEMEKIATAVNNVADTIRNLEGYSEQISSIVNTIREIADQTNLLALNAAIEAARAGEQGRGFAVVADEVRKLAERTAISTKEISSMIAKIQDGTKQAAQEMDVSVKRVSDGVGLARKAGTSVSSISEAALHAAHAVDDITSAIQEQSLAARDIAQRIEKIAQGTEENSLASSQTASSAQKMTELSKQLDELAARFRIA
ncbi:MAG: MCP four helix bundle domain-containing protein [Gammaproteobacteria bacterium]|nr:MCP four helix bundle domain-containing protein [Gammaproteobacteria bacterium]MBU1625430.1 MCP four helix bundle domain-containing protein [Gammaproteobacteria bacterium]MBU1981690.1 MCP four helix bundle domain-containing protein [Gammaproteobacteria bacterium]